LNSYKAELTHRNVVVVKYKNVTKGWEQWVQLTGDRHHDNPRSNWKLEREQLEKAKKRQAHIVDVGDLFCAMQGKYDPRSSMDDLRPENVREDYLDGLIETAAEFYTPYAENFLVIGYGNHESNIRKRHGVDLTSNLVHHLNYEGGKVFPGFYGGWVRFVFKVNNSQSISKNLYYHHGAGGGGPCYPGRHSDQPPGRVYAGC